MTSRRTTWTRRLARWALALGVVCGATSGLTLPQPPPAALAQSPAAPLDEARARFAEQSRAVERLRQAAQDLDQRHRALADQIAARKQGRSNADLVGDGKLQDLLAQARGLADELYRLQPTLHEQERRLEEARRGVLAGYDAQILRLEDSILDPTLLSQRDGAIQEMNRLRRERHAYLPPTQGPSSRSAPALPSAAIPSTRDIRDPEEALAVLAELNDTDRRLLTRVEELDRRISQMEAEQRLRRKARDFQERQAFFDDDRTGGRRVASTGSGARLAPETTRDPAAAGKGGSDSAASGGGPRDDSGNNAAPSNNGGAPLVDAAPPQGPSEGFEADVSAEGANNAASAPEPSNELPSATVGGEVFLPSVGLPPDPFASEGVVSQSDAEYLGAGAGRAEPSGTLEEQLRRTKRERELLLRKSRELQQRAQDLKRLADDL